MVFKILARWIEWMQVFINTHLRRQPPGFSDSYNEFVKRISAAKASQPVRPSVYGFVAGTLVHTQNGLMPIQTIQVGDLVLSKPESGTEQPSFKRVTGISVQVAPYVMICVFYPLSEEIKAKKEGGLINPLTYRYFVFSQDTLFCFRHHRWSVIASNSWGHEAEMLENDFAVIGEICLVRITPDKDVGWYIFGDDTNNNEGTLIDLKDDQVKVNLGEEVFNEDVKWCGDGCEMPRTVYHLDVEDNHTYYVSEYGLLVHSHNPKTMTSRESLESSQDQH